MAGATTAAGTAVCNDADVLDTDDDAASSGAMNAGCCDDTASSGAMNAGFCDDTAGCAAPAAGVLIMYTGGGGGGKSNCESVAGIVLATRGGRGSRGSRSGGGDGGATFAGGGATSAGSLTLRVKAAPQYGSSAIDRKS